MLFDDLLKAAVPDPVVCLGVPLRPLSIGALLLLHRYENKFLLFARSAESPVGTTSASSPFNSPFPTVPLGDFLQAILACSLPFADAQAALFSPDLHCELKLWERKLRAGVRIRFSPGRSDKAFIELIRRDASRFVRYLRAGLAYPCTKAELGPERPIGSPWLMFTLTALLGDLNQSFETAVNLPLPFARWLLASNAERKGLLEVVERSELAGLKAEADQIAAEVEAAEKLKLNT